MDLKKSRAIMWIGICFSILIMLIGIAFEKENITFWFMIAGTVIFLITLLQAFIFYRCPECGFSLMNVKGSIPVFCPKCGKQIKDELQGENNDERNHFNKK